MRLRFRALIPLLAPFLASAAFAQTRTSVDTQSLRLPEVGDRQVRILSPTLLEVTVITDRPALPQTTEKNGGGDQPVSLPPPGAQQCDVRIDGKPAAIERMGRKRRAIYAPVRDDDLRVATWTYVELRNPIPSADSPAQVEVSIGNSSEPLRVTWDPNRENPAIHVNQEGYEPDLLKEAVLGYYLGDLGEMTVSESSGFSLVEIQSGKEVFRGKLQLRQDLGYRTYPKPYQNVVVADFSEFKRPGEYVVRIPGLGQSEPFLIQDGIAMGFVRTYALGLYHQRCGEALQMPFTRFTHDACHVAPAEVPVPQSAFPFTWTTIASKNTDTSKVDPVGTGPRLDSEAAQLYPFVKKGTVDISGGHHDAGDYSKYTTNSAELIHYLIFTVDSIPGASELDNLGIPESGDGISDILQEAKWEAEFLSKMQDEDGGFYFLVYPKEREYESNVLPDKGDAQVVWPKNTVSTAAATAALAQCASSPQFKLHYPALAAKYLRQAQRGWTFLTKAIEDHGKAGAYQKITFYGDNFGHDDELAWAACELYLATGRPEFQDKLFEWFPNPAAADTLRWGWRRMSESWGNAIRSYAFAARSGRLPISALDKRYLGSCENQVVAAGDDALTWSRSNAYGTPFPLETKAVLGGGWYFSLDQASDMAVAWQIEPKPGYREAVVQAMNFEAGCNPVNVAFLTGIGRHRQREIVDQYAQNDRRVLPPSGIPIGNLQTSFDYLPLYKGLLRALTYPSDTASSNPYPMYDRWADAFNVSTEFITVNQARGLMASVFIAHGTSDEGKAWSKAEGHIDLADKPKADGGPLTARFEASGADLKDARIVWEAEDQEPAFGPQYSFVPKSNGRQWIEAEAEWPDGRRSFGVKNFSFISPHFTWFDGALPKGSAPASSGGDTWQWVNSAGKEAESKRVHESSAGGGLHEHWFTGATEPMNVESNGSLFVWVRLDPRNPPSEIMVMWNDGQSWEHRAYWGADTITYGKDRSPGRLPLGPLPEGGQWIKLAVPADSVGLADKAVTGMGFSAVGGGASWGAAGLDSSAPR